MVSSKCRVQAHDWTAAYSARSLRVLPQLPMPGDLSVLPLCSSVSDFCDALVENLVEQFKGGEVYPDSVSGHSAHSSGDAMAVARALQE